MPRKPSWPPPVYVTRGREYARVYRDGKPKDYPLGPAGSPEARIAYVRLQADLLAAKAGEPVPPKAVSSSPLTVTEALHLFAAHASRKHPPKELWHFRRALGFVLEMFGDLPLAGFGPRQLTALKAHLAGLGWCRRVCNHALGRVRTAWRWLEAEGLAAPGTWHALRAVPGLAHGEAADREEVLPVPEADLQATLPHLSPTVRAAVLTQLHSGGRPSEVLGLRPADIQRGGRVTLRPGLVVDLGGVWAAVLARHKTMRLGRPRVLLFGPAAQAALAPFLDRPAEAYLFSPREAYLWHCETRGRRPNLARRSRPPGDQYTPGSYLRAIHYGCRKAGVGPWSAYALRHNAGTMLASEFGPEVARVVLGHRSLDTTKIYILENLAKAAEAIRRVG